MTALDTLYQPDLFDFITDVDAEIASLDPGDTFGLCEALHQSAARILPVDAAYVCLYSEEDQTLFFPYKWDSGVLDAPNTAPLGGGPTSKAIRQGRPIVWGCPDEMLPPLGHRFGERAQISNSAVHTPLRDTGTDGRDGILGVFSVQSYQPHAYDDRAVRVMEWLAARGALALQRARTEGLWEFRLAAAEAKAAERQRRMVGVTQTFVGIIHNITEEAHALLAELPADARNLRASVVNLCRTCHHAEAEANEIPMKPAPCREAACPLIAAAAEKAAGNSNGKATTVPDPDDADIPTLHADLAKQLTDREQDVLRLLAAGHKNADIALALYISPATVKYHLASIYRKLDVSNRVQAIRAVQG